MKKTAKAKAIIGMASMMVAGTAMSVFANDAPITIFGQKPVESKTSGTDTYFSVIVSGADVLKGSDIQVVDGSWRSVWWHGQDIVLDDVTSEYYEPVTIDFDKEADGNLYIQKVFVSYVPENVDINSLGDDAKYVISAGATGSAVSAAQPAEKTASWAQDSKGWWIQYSDGTYLTNSWYQSPASGLWYYMGADGYMLTNTTTPDGYYVNADGVWMQNQNNQTQQIVNTTTDDTENLDPAKTYTTITDKKGNVFNNVEVEESFHNPNSGLPKQPDSYILNPGHKDDSKNVWKFQVSTTADDERIYVYLNFDESWYQYERKLKMIINAWLNHPEYGMDFWDLELKGGRTQKYYPVWGAYVYSDAIYNEITSVITKFYPHDEANTVTYTGQGLTSDILAKSKKSELYKKNSTTVTDTYDPNATPGDDYKKEHNIGFY